MYLFGPLIIAPPAHPDTVLTSVMYMMQSLTDLGMTYIHLSPDMQLYIQAMQIKWNEPQAFDKLIMRPSVMHIVQNVCGCIGQLMMGSGLANLIGSAFGGVGSIMAQGNHGCVRCAHSGWYLQFSCNHSCRPVSRRGMRSASTLRRHVCNLQAVTGWTTSSRPDLITPTLLIHQLLRSEREGDWLFQQLCIRRLLPYFFIAGHHNYARYLSWHCLEMAILLPAMAKDDLLSGAFVCRHKAGSCNAVSADQFGEQTAITIGKGGLKGITLSPEQVAEWIDSFPISAYVSDALDHCYSPDQANSSSETPHKEEGIKRRNVDTDDRRRISEELDKCSHPLEIESDVLYNIVNVQVAPALVNVSDAVSLGALMVTDFRKSLPAGFHAKLSSPVKTMEKLKHGIKIGDQVVFDLESIFIRLLLVAQQREMEPLPIFGYELCAVPPSLVDEYGWLRKGNKAVLITTASYDTTCDLILCYWTSITMN